MKKPLPSIPLTPQHMAIEHCRRHHITVFSNGSADRTMIEPCSVSVCVNRRRDSSWLPGLFSSTDRSFVSTDSFFFRMNGVRAVGSRMSGCCGWAPFASHCAHRTANESQRVHTKRNSSTMSLHSTHCFTRSTDCRSEMCLQCASSSSRDIIWNTLGCFCLGASQRKSHRDPAHGRDESLEGEVREETLRVVPFIAAARHTPGSAILHALSADESPLQACAPVAAVAVPHRFPAAAALSSAAVVAESGR
jgi:hypothetical protein